MNVPVRRKNVDVVLRYEDVWGAENGYGREIRGGMRSKMGPRPSKLSGWLILSSKEWA